MREIEARILFEILIWKIHFKAKLLQAFFQEAMMTTGFVRALYAVAHFFAVNSMQNIKAKGQNRRLIGERKHMTINFRLFF